MPLKLQPEFCESQMSESHDVTAGYLLENPFHDILGKIKTVLLLHRIMKFVN